MAKESRLNAVEEFLQHQKSALEQAGKAVGSLLPKGFLEHSQNALEHSVRGVGAVAEALGQEAKKAGGELKKGWNRLTKAEDTEASATKVQVEIEE